MASPIIRLENVQRTYHVGDVDVHALRDVSLIGSIRRECLDHIIIFNEHHLRRVLSSYFQYHHQTRTHLSLDKDCPETRPIHPPTAGKIIAFPQVGGCECAVRLVFQSRCVGCSTTKRRLLNCGVKMLKGLIAGVALTAAAALVGGYILLQSGLIPANADATPGQMETWIARTSLDATLNREAPKGPNPIAMTDTNLSLRSIDLNDEPTCGRAAGGAAQDGGLSSRFRC
jgi:hypothetical protein